MKKIVIIGLFLIFSIPVFALEGENIQGIGIQTILNKDNNFEIISIMNNSPAEKAGLKPKDIILEIDNNKTTSLDNLSMIKGQVGTNVKLLIKRGEKNMEFCITRNNIFISDYVEIVEKVYFFKKYLKYEDGIYYFWIKELYGAWDKNYNYGYKDYLFSRQMWAVNVKEQSCGIVKYLVYNKNNDCIDEVDYTGNIDFKEVSPNTKGYLYFSVINAIDKKIGEKKETFKGFLK